ncbi:MAG TPA: anti-sigma factor [Steroidobacteraceae bacterium]|nr:anti-sigma factor [Steroidobacteraceae bacterium]
MNSPTLPPENDGPPSNEPPSDDVLAGEYVLGVLDTIARRQVQARLETDREFARRVAEWEVRFAPLLADIEPVEAPAAVWNAVCQRLGWVDPVRPRSGFWQSLGFWRGATAVSTIIAVAALAVTVERLSMVNAPPVAQQAVEPAAKPVTPLQHDDGTPGWLASVDAVRGTVLMVPVPSAPDAQGRVPELWLIPAGKAPVSLGAVSITRSHTVTVPQRARADLVAGSTLAITLEPPSGIPHAAPSSAVIAKGTIQQLVTAS